MKTRNCASCYHFDSLGVDTPRGLCRAGTPQPGNGQVPPGTIVTKRPRVQLFAIWPEVHATEDRCRAHETEEEFNHGRS